MTFESSLTPLLATEKIYLDLLPNFRQVRTALFLFLYVTKVFNYPDNSLKCMSIIFFMLLKAIPNVTSIVNIMTS